jgi:hypothetical protein
VGWGRGWVVVGVGDLEGVGGAPSSPSNPGDACDKAIRQLRAPAK